MLPDLRTEPNLLARFEKDVELAGLVGERQNAKIILVAAVSAKLQKPLNVSVGGGSSSGKNHLINAVARFIPDEDKRILTGMSAKVLMHSKEDEYQNKAVFIAEYEGVSAADYAIRTMQSERSIDWEFVESSTHGIQKKTRRVKGPVAFIQATTRVTLHPENETRLLFLQMDESEPQTRAVIQSQAMEAEMKTQPPPPDLFDKWHCLLRGLAASPVLIPFATQLGEQFPADRIRSRRDFPKLLGLIEVSAHLHQHRRRREQGQIIADPGDYMAAKELFQHCYYTRPEAVVGDLLKAAESIGKEFVVADLVEKTKWGRSKTYQVLDRAQELGCIAEGAQRGRYRFLHKHTEAPLSLPSKITLKADKFHISTWTAPLSHPDQERAQAGESNGETEEQVGGHFGGKPENAAILPPAPATLAGLRELEAGLGCQAA